MKKVSPHDKKGLSSRAQGAQGKHWPQDLKFHHLRINVSGNDREPTDLPRQTAATMHR